MTITVVDAGPNKVSRAAEVNAPASALFDIVADPQRHSELDGSGTVSDTLKGPDRLSQGAKFTVKMKQYGVPYRITSKVTAFVDGRLLEWRHPLGHSWRWEFEPTSDNSTRITETFDYSGVPAVQAKALSVAGFPKQNAAGIEETLRQLQSKYPN